VFRTCLVASLVLITACGSDPDEDRSPTGTTSVAAPAGTIAYTGFRGSSSDIYLVNADGSDVVALTSGSANDAQPAWSPDGTRLAYASGPGNWNGGRLNIWVMNSDGSGKTRLTSGDHNDGFPAWSPDGRRIVFTRRDGTGPDHLFSMLADGTDLQQLTTADAADILPTWTISDRILFVRIRTGTGYGDVYVVNADGTGAPAPLTSGQRVADYALSPDGTQLLIHDGVRETLVLRSLYARGDPVTISSDFTLASVRLSWSPNSEWVAIGGDFRGPLMDLQLVAADGSRRMEVPGANDATDPAWRPEAPT